MSQTLHADALVVHLFVAADGPHDEEDREYLTRLWNRVRAEFELDAPIADLPKRPALTGRSGLLAGRRDPRVTVPHVAEMLLRRTHDTYCLSVMREPAGGSWAALQDRWAAVMDGFAPSPGVIGSAQIFLARMGGAGAPTPHTEAVRPDPDLLDPVVRRRLPAPAGIPAPRWQSAGSTSHGFAVWESSEPADGRTTRRIVVVAPDDSDERLSGWTWVVGAERDLPPLGRYLLHAAKLRHQLGVWNEERDRYREVRRHADQAVDRLLALLAHGAGRGPSSERLLEAAQELTELQASERGLVRTSTALIEMRRTVDICTANLAAQSDPDVGGPFAEDRELGAWLSQQLDDDVVYVGAARERAGQLAGLTDQLLHRRSQDERERFNLAFTGAIGAILMVLAASQSFGYTPPLSSMVRPAVVAMLGALALLSTLAMLWIVGRGARWPRVLMWVGWGLLGASLAWVVVSAVLGASGTAEATRWWALAGFAVAGLSAVTWSTAVAARRRRAPSG